MLTNFHILDLAVVKALDLELGQGLAVLTGETGAGKSILLTALGLALGGRADAGFIRPGSKRAEVCLEFDLADAQAARQWLGEHEFDDGASCLIRRLVNHDGRSKAYINNRPATLQSLQALGGKLVEIHGQHAHLRLLAADEQRRLLDSFAANQPLLDELQQCHRQWRQADQELAALRKAVAHASARQELLAHQISELRQLDMGRFDYPALSAEHDRIANLGQILQTGQALLYSLYENDQMSAHKALRQAIAELQQLARYAPALADIGGLLQEASLHTEEAALQLRRFLEHQEADPGRLALLAQQLSAIHNLSRKHQIKPGQLPAKLAELEEELAGLTASDERLQALAAKAEALKAAYQALAGRLSERRRGGGQRLQQRISAMIKALGMPHGEFLVTVEHQPDAAPKPHGLDAVSFLVSANPGLPAKPLAKVASGGELSRISLAIQVTTANDNTTPTMIFDEVDAGIGGGVAQIVGQKLRALGQGRQVLCVTHLPQVAAQAHNHLYVEKIQQADGTTSTVRWLGGGERVNELARMLGGVQITANTLAHAQEMLDHADADGEPL